MIEYMLVIEIEASLNILRNLKSNFFVNNRMQCMYPLVKVEIVDLFAGERGGGGII
jgi:hypothetical protein